MTSADVGEHVRTHHQSQEREVRQRMLDMIRTEFRTMLIATAGFAGAGLVVWIPKMFIIAGLGLVCGFARQWARIPAAKGNLQAAVAIFAAGMWASTMFTVALVPLALPVMVFNIIVPVVLAATYLDDREHWPIALAGVGVAAVVGVLGLTQDGLEVQEGVAEWLIDWTTIVFLVGYTWMFNATVRDANRTRVATLDLALAANDELVETQRELKRSRRRLIELADRERGRIERNIHDGAQQRLVSTAVRLKLASQLSEQGQSPSTESLALMHEEVNVALHELRELAQGIYPSLLTERGLVEAVSSLCRRGTLSANVTGELTSELSQDVQSAVYFFCAEAIQNSSKHAGSDARLTVEFDQPGADLAITIADTGRGFDPGQVANSRGILNMTDRIEAIDGALTIESAGDRGTMLRAIVPLATR